MWEIWVQSLGREDTLEKEMATHSSILAWRIPWMEELGGLQSTSRKESDMTERLHFHFHLWLNLVWSSALKDFATVLLWTSFCKTVDTVYCSQQERHSELCSFAHTRTWQAATWISSASRMKTFTAITRKGKSSRVLYENSSPFYIICTEEWPYGSQESEHREPCQGMGTVHPEVSSQTHGV